MSKTWCEFLIFASEKRIQATLYNWGQAIFDLTQNFRTFQFYLTSQMYSLKWKASSVWGIISYTAEANTQNAVKMKWFIAHQMQIQNKPQTTPAWVE